MACSGKRLLQQVFLEHKAPQSVVRVLHPVQWYRTQVIGCRCELQRGITSHLQNIKNAALATRVSGDSKGCQALCNQAVQVQTSAAVRLASHRCNAKRPACCWYAGCVSHLILKTG
jgi:hypothetical protein